MMMEPDYSQEPWKEEVEELVWMEYGMVWLKELEKKEEEEVEHSVSDVKLTNDSLFITQNDFHLLGEGLSSIIKEIRPVARRVSLLSL